MGKFARACSYDRAGTGWSDAGPSPRTSREIVRELHSLLANSGIPGPYVLVGHSFGGYIIRLFTHEYPQETAGIVLVDASHEEQSVKIPPALQQKKREVMHQLQLGRILSPFGIVRLFFNKPNEKYPGDLQPVGVALASRTGYLTTYYHELLSFDESAAQVRTGTSLPQVPIAVVSAGREGEKAEPGIGSADWDRFRAVWRDLQADLSTRSTNSIHVTAVNSTHYVQLDQPAMVVAAIRRVVQAVRKNEPLRAVGD